MIEFAANKLRLAWDWNQTHGLSAYMPGRVAIFRKGSTFIASEIQTLKTMPWQLGSSQITAGLVYGWGIQA